MQHFELRSLRSSLKAVRLLRLSIAQSITAGLVVAALPATALTYNDASDSTFRSTRRDYQTCIADITGTGVEAAAAATACGAALYPRDLSRCVVRIDSSTALTSSDALSNCREVRRPVELSTCVVDITEIDNPTDSEPLLNVVDHCRRSLLPVRFSACVVGLRSQVDLSTEDILTDCIAATNRPRDVLPSFLPGNTVPTLPPQVEPLQPQPAPEQLQQPAPEQIQQP